MRQLILLLLVSSLCGMRTRDVAMSVDVQRALDFKTDIQPIFEPKCQPCHFAGGKMYEKLPFDRPATILRLGDKLFTRIKDEPSRAKIRAFLAQNATH